MKQTLLVAAAAAMVAGGAFAQMLPVAQTADPVEVGKLMGTAGFNIGLGDAKAKSFGVRATYGAIENLSVFGDLAMVDVGDSSKVSLGVGAEYSLAMLDVKPVDLAVRAEYAEVDFKFKDLGFISALAMASMKIEQVDGLAVYGGVGIAYPLVSGGESKFVIDVGAKYALPVENLSVFVEFSHADESAIGAGVVYAF
jgi:hypothetical protein